MYNGRNNNVQTPPPAYPQNNGHQSDSYELHNASNWQNRTDNPLQSNSTTDNVQHNATYTNRRYNEGVI
jgi:hypothetical protein